MIEVKNLSFSYNKSEFIKDMNFHVNEGEIFGFLGPSGAGKSTLQKILTGIILSYKGSVIVNNTEMKHRTNQFYENIGVDFEFPSLYEKLTAYENLSFFSSLYDRKTRSIEELLASVNLLEDAHKKVFEYSKGMKSRLNFIKALIHSPKVLFLDEPTSGLDPVNAHTMKNIIKEEKDKGTTIILTTHNMIDATELCDRVAFIVDGNIKALDSPHNLIMSYGAQKVYYSYIDNGKEVQKEHLLQNISDDKVLAKIIKENRLQSIHSSEPTLSDIFMDITGRTLV